MLHISLNCPLKKFAFRLPSIPILVTFLPYIHTILIFSVIHIFSLATSTIFQTRYFCFLVNLFEQLIVESNQNRELVKMFELLGIPMMFCALLN